MRSHIRWGIEEVASAIEAAPIAVEWRLPRAGAIGPSITPRRLAARKG